MEPRELTIESAIPDVRGVLETDAGTEVVEVAATATTSVTGPAEDAERVPEVTAPAPLSPLRDSARVLAGYLELDRHELARRDEILHRHRVLRRTLAFADLATLALVLFVATGHLAAGGLSLTAPLVMVGLIFVMKALGLYDRDEHRLHRTTLDEIPRLFQVTTLCTLVIWLLGDLLVVGGEFERAQILLTWAIFFSLLIIGRSLARHLATRFTSPERCLVIGDAEAAEAVRAKLRLTGSHPAEVVGWLEGKTVAGGSGGSRPVLPHGLYGVMAEKCIHRVIVAPGKVDGDALLHMVRELSDMQVSVSVLPATPPVAGSSVELDDIHGLTLLGVKTFEMNRSSRMLKRSFDVALSSIALVVLSPLLLATAIAIKLDSRGPVLFRQRRIGRHGKAFEILKFRSMFDGSHELRESLRDQSTAGDGFFKLEEDPRVTKVGRVLRAWSLDELPQLVNVLRGEMSLVGPRPLVPDEDSLIEGYYRERLDIAPGITGYWQALGSYRVPLFEMVRLDYLYVATWSLWNDLQILLRTIPYVVGRRGV